MVVLRVTMIMEIIYTTLMMHWIYEYKEFDEDQGDYDKKPAAKKVPGGEFCPKKESLGILRQFLNKQTSLKPPLLFAQTKEQEVTYSHSNDDDDSILEEETGGQYDEDELFQDDKEDMMEDLSYYCSIARVGVGQKLSVGGPSKPDTSNMTESESSMVLKEWMVAWKAYADVVQCECRKSLGTNTSSNFTYSGVLNDRLHIMTEVESSPLLAVNHTFSEKELLLI